MAERIILTVQPKFLVPLLGSGAGELVKFVSWQVSKLASSWRQQFARPGVY